MVGFGEVPKAQPNPSFCGTDCLHQRIARNTHTMSFPRGSKYHLRSYLDPHYKVLGSSAFQDS